MEQWGGEIGVERGPAESERESFENRAVIWIIAPFKWPILEQTPFSSSPNPITLHQEWQQLQHKGPRNNSRACAFALIRESELMTLSLNPFKGPYANQKEEDREEGPRGCCYCALRNRKQKMVVDTYHKHTSSKGNMWSSKRKIMAHWRETVTVVQTPGRV